MLLTALVNLAIGYSRLSFEQSGDVRNFLTSIETAWCRLRESQRRPSNLS